MNDELDIKLSVLFKEHSVNPSDKGFTDRIIRQLPRRRNVLTSKPIILAVSMLLGVLAFILAGGFDLLLVACLLALSDVLQLSFPSIGGVLYVLAFFVCAALVPIIEYSSSSS